MRLLLDIHAFVWWIADSCRLSERAYALIADETHEVLVSAASAWEMATKYRLQKLDLPELAAFDMAGAIAGQGSGSFRSAFRTRHLPDISRNPTATPSTEC